MDRKRTDGSPRNCDHCEATKPKQYDWITRTTLNVEISGTWCSWTCFNAWFNVAWAEANLDIPDTGGEG